ncbi:16S rRNA (cytosine(1402)-N(4))-methyltransferase RsmH [Candidatus Dojkabacteria bacterium]|uniref:Ribosomal RNA small subunit methyltransferase H n=1 Tax=Candidatus Dojkabacteria bacterium TaxID=2099670 RepID=A0A955L797_9BACT|nr:16S rRNA (cytosine(1402)-N(4))-methyltransferase RsmH [Candidatus Dojkabacteria bacterium]
MSEGITKHIPVLLHQLVESLEIKPGDVVVDATLGGGGHANETLKKLEGDGVFIAFDTDEEAITRFEGVLKDGGFKSLTDEDGVVTLEKSSLRIHLINRNFRTLEKSLSKLNITKVSKVYADLGFSTDQLNKSLSYKVDGELDLRMDAGLQVKAADLLNVLFEKELISIFENYADEQLAKPLAREIVKRRKEKLFETKEDLNLVIRELVERFNIQQSSRNFSPEPRIYQALRIAVNDEYGALEEFIENSFTILAPQGLMGIISFHSGEDRIVKKLSKDYIRSGKAIWKNELVQPSKSEIRANKKSRSAKLRVVQRVA